MQSITVSIAYADHQQQWLKEITVQRGASVGDAVIKSGFLQDVDGLVGRSVDSLSLGVYAQKVDPDTLLEDGDRVEIYRPLIADPKEVRRQLALMGKTMGSK